MKIVNIAEKQTKPKENKNNNKKKPTLLLWRTQKEREWSVETEGCIQGKGFFSNKLEHHGVAKTELEILDLNCSSAALGSWLAVTTDMLMSLADN